MTDPQAALDALANAQAEVEAMEASALAELEDAKENLRQNPNDDAAAAREREAVEVVQAIRAMVRKGRGVGLSPDMVPSVDNGQEG